MQFGALMIFRMVNGVCALIPEEGGGKEDFSECEGFSWENSRAAAMTKLQP